MDSVVCHEVVGGLMDTEMGKTANKETEKMVVPRKYTTSLVFDGSEICGFEVAPCASDSGETLSTMLSNSFGSLTTRSDSESDEYAIHLREEATPEIVGASLLIRSRVEDLLEGLDGNVKKKDEDPILILQVEYIDLDPQEEDESNPLASLPSVTNSALAKKTVLNLEKQFFNLLEPKPSQAFCDMIGRSQQALCQLMLDTLDVPFLFHRRPPSPSMDGISLQAPFMMFQKRSRALVSIDDERSCIVSSSGPLTEGSITRLFNVQGLVNGRHVKLKSFAFRDDVPSMKGTEGTKPVSLDSSMLQVRLQGWKRGSFGRMLMMPESTPTDPEQREHLSKKHEHEKVLVLQNTALLPLFAGHDKGDDVASLFADEELRAVLKITRDGEEASPLFPSFSDDSHKSWDACSDDGLDEEIGALEGCNDQLRKELAIAEVVIKGSESYDGIMKARRVFISKKKFPEPDDPNDTETTLSMTDSEHSEEGPHWRMVQPKKGHGRHVRFSERNDEFFFIAERPILINDSDEATYTDEGPHTWYSSVEGIYLLFEDMMDDLAQTCTLYTTECQQRSAAS
jgi:hypothetical protein